MSFPDSMPTGFRASRRVVSAPVAPRPRTADAPASPSFATRFSPSVVETLYIHPNVKIAAFTTSGKALLLSADAARKEAGTLPPSSHMERTLAVGMHTCFYFPATCR